MKSDKKKPTPTSNKPVDTKSGGSKPGQSRKGTVGTGKKKGEKEIEPEIDDSGPHIFEIIQKNIAKNFVPPKKIEKALLLNYTIAILKPMCRIIIDKIEKEKFEIFDFKSKILTNEEVENLYFKHAKKDYFTSILEYMTSGPVAILVLINKLETYMDENGIKTFYQSPIMRWKDFIGYKDPAQAKLANPNSLRAIYGVDIIKNEFWGSDSPSDAYRELCIFMMPLPSRPPVYVYDQNKLPLDVILNFLFPIKPDHPDVSGRLDTFARYGPVLNYHVLDLCICTSCKAKVKAGLLEEGKTLKLAKDKIITDEFIHKHSGIFCSKCFSHFNTWTHLFSGSEGTHIMTSEEIDFLILEMNKEDLSQILKAEKGTSANTILSTIDLKKPPSEIQYTKQHILNLFSSADVDYYDRYDFGELQNLILEDRRIRLNFWASKMIERPVDTFPNPKLINFNSDSDSSYLKDIHNLKSKNFTLLRTHPIKVKNVEEDSLKKIVLQHPIFVKEKLTDHEINQKVEKLLSKNFCKVSNMEAQNDKNMMSNMILLRNYQLATLKSNAEKEALKKEKERINNLKYK